MDSCKHHNFTTESKITRLTDDNGEVKDYMVDIEIHCSDCFKPFVWKGLPVGLNFDSPTVSFDRTELRIPIEPIH